MLRELAKSGDPAFDLTMAFDAQDGGVGAGLSRATETAEHQSRTLETQHNRLVEMFMQAPGFIAVLGGPSHVIQLTNEAYLRLVGQEDVQFADRAAFFAYAASAMRSVVVDHARARLALKRGGGDTVQRVADLPDNVNDGIRLDEDLLSLDSALSQLNDVDPQLARIVELRYFAGLSELQIAELTERSERSVRRDWQKARMFLLQMLQGR